jgi:hypothetical protein
MPRFNIVLGNSAGALDEKIVEIAEANEFMGVTRAVIEFIEDMPLADGDTITIREIRETED